MCILVFCGGVGGFIAGWVPFVCPWWWVLLRILWKLRRRGDGRVVVWRAVGCLRHYLLVGCVSGLVLGCWPFGVGGGGVGVLFEICIVDAMHLCSFFACFLRV